MLRQLASVVGSCARAVLALMQRSRPCSILGVQASLRRKQEASVVQASEHAGHARCPWTAELAAPGTARHMCWNRWACSTLVAHAGCGAAKPSSRGLLSRRLSTTSQSMSAGCCGGTARSARGAAAPVLGDSTANSQGTSRSCESNRAASSRGLRCRRSPVGTGGRTGAARATAVSI